MSVLARLCAWETPEADAICGKGWRLVFDEDFALEEFVGAVYVSPPRQPEAGASSAFVWRCVKGCFG